MGQGINNIFQKFLNLPAKSRENERFVAPTGDDSSYFAQAAQQHKLAKDLALDSYFDTLNALEQLISEQSSYNLTSKSSDAKESIEKAAKEKEEYYEEKATEYKNKADKEDELYQSNNLKASVVAEKEAEKNNVEQHEKETENNAPQEENSLTSSKETNNENIFTQKAVVDEPETDNYEAKSSEITTNKSQEEDLQPSSKEASNENIVTAKAAVDEPETNKSEAKKNEIDPVSKAAIDEFMAIINNKKNTADEMGELYLRYSRQISINSPEAWGELDNTYNNALSKAHVPNNTTDTQSKNAITNFKTAINPSMTKDEMVENFVRFSREISVKFPEAWNELESILSNALPTAYKPNTSMDTQSKNAITNFKGAVNAGMTSDEMNETYLRFIREVSVKFPEAWNEMESTLNNYLPTAFQPNTSMDDQSKNATVNFKANLNENLTKDEMVELFTRFSREVSVKFPDAWQELESTLNQGLPKAFKHNTKSDPYSEQAVINFKNTINKKHTKDDLTEMFLRFSRDISNKYPEKKNELIAIFNDALPTAYNPDTKTDKDSSAFVNNFKSFIQSQDMEKDTFNKVFSDFFNQAGVDLTKAGKMMGELKSEKLSESEKKTEKRNKDQQNSQKLNIQFASLVNNVNDIDYKVTTASSQLKNTFDKDTQKAKTDEIDRMMNNKEDKDTEYLTLMAQIGNNNVASNNIKDNYLFNMFVDKTAPDKKELLQRDSQKMTEFDMLRTMRREDVKDMLYQIPDESLSDMLYSVPKFQLINGLTLLPHEQQIEALTTNRFEDALLKEMPRKQLIEQLPDAYEMLPVLMMMGKTESGLNNGVELIEDALINGSKVEEPKNETRAQEDLLPFIMEQLLNKTPRLADANNPSLGHISPVKAQMNKMQDTNIFAKNQTKKQTEITRVEDLQPDQLKELSQEAINEFTEDDTVKASATQRGDSQDLVNFLQDIKKVDSVDAGKMAMSNLYNSQAQGLKDMVLPKLSDRELLKVNKMYGRDPKEMVKALPTNVVEKQLHDLNRIQLVESYKKAGKDMIMDRVQALPSQTLANAAADILNRDSIFSLFANKDGIAA